jgi:hypothetical protein
VEEEGELAVVVYCARPAPTSSANAALAAFASREELDNDERKNEQQLTCSIPLISLFSSSVYFLRFSPTL